MFTPSADIILLLQSFSCCFTSPAFSKMVLLVCGAILTPGRRTVASALRAVGRSSSKTFGSYHRLLSRDRWSALGASKYLWSLLLENFIPRDQAIDIVVDETLERRRGKKIEYKGWFRDAVRSTRASVVTTSGIRWLCFCVLAPVPWSIRRWALPFLTFPCQSEKTCAKRKRAHRGSAGLTIDGLIEIRKWIGTERLLRLIADGGFTNMELLHFCKSLNVTQIGRLRIDAKIYDEPDNAPNKPGPRSKKGKRQPSFKDRIASGIGLDWRTVELALNDGNLRTLQIASGVSLWHVPNFDPVRLRWVVVRPSEGGSIKEAAAFFSTDITMGDEQIVALYAERWNIEVFFEEVRACLGFETQRGWTNRTIGRTTPCLFGIFSLVVILAKRLYPTGLPCRKAAWYAKEQATFRDVLAIVREHLWEHGFAVQEINQEVENAIGSAKNADHRLIPAALIAAVREMACYAA